MPSSTVWLVAAAVISRKRRQATVLMAEAVEECRKQAWEMQDTLEKLAAESLSLGMPLARRRGPPCATAYRKALDEGFSATEALAMASAEPLPVKAKPYACRGN